MVHHTWQASGSKAVIEYTMRFCCLSLALFSESLLRPIGVMWNGFQRNNKKQLGIKSKHFNIAQETIDNDVHLQHCIVC